MAFKRWSGGAAAKTWTRKYFAPDAGGGVTFSVPTGKKLEFTTWDADTIVDAFTNTDIPEFLEVTASSDSGHLVLTSNIPGVPHDIAASVAPDITIETVQAGQSAVNQVTTITLPSGTAGGTWSLTLDGGGGNETASSLAWNITAANLKAAIAALTGWSTSDVDVTGSAGETYTITFKGAYAGLSVDVNVDGSSLTGNGTVTVAVEQEAGTGNEVQAVVIYNTAGSLTLQWGAESASANFTGWSNAGALAANQSAIETAIESFTGLSGNVNVTVKAGYDGILGGSNVWMVIVVEFIGALKQTNPGDTLQVQYANATFTGSTGFTRLQEGGGTSNNEIYVLVSNGTSGTYTVDQSASSTSAIADSDAWFTVRSELETLTGETIDALPTGGGGALVFAIDSNSDEADLTVTDSTSSPSAFLADLSGTEITKITDGGAINEIQSIVVTGRGGTFALTSEAQTTSAIAYGAAPSAIDTAIEALSSRDTVTVTGSGTSVDPYLVEFTGADAGSNIPLMTADASSLNNPDDPTVSATTPVAGQNEIQRYTITPNTSGGTYRVRRSAEFSGAIAYDAAAGTIETALEAVSDITSVTVTGTHEATIDVEFDGADGKANQPLLVFDVSQLTAASSGIDQQQTIAADGPNHWNNPQNWNGGELPMTGDDVILGETDHDIKYGMITLAAVNIDTSTDVLTCSGGHDFVNGQTVKFSTTGSLSGTGVDTTTTYYVIGADRDAGTLQVSTSENGSAVDLTGVGSGTHTVGLRLNSFLQFSNFENDAGLPELNQDGDSYIEYRNRYLAFGLQGDRKITIGSGPGGGSSLIRIDHGADQALIDVQSSGSSNDDQPAIVLTGTNANSDLEMLGGSVGYAAEETETGKQIGRVMKRGGSLETGPGLTVNTLYEVTDSDLPRSRGTTFDCPVQMI